ncbi:MAG: hypothetical protein JW864_13315 [Spirochaetes bacterium]|nr:hypothetical protein [Spirochaetota bacterium]
MNYQAVIIKPGLKTLTSTPMDFVYIARKGSPKKTIDSLTKKLDISISALATREMLVHLPLNIIPAGMIISSLELPDKLSMETIEVSDLPKNWSVYPAPLNLAKPGTGWAGKCNTVALRVLSLVIPFGEVYNLKHPDFTGIRIIKKFIQLQFKAVLKTVELLLILIILL